MPLISKNFRLLWRLLSYQMLQYLSATELNTGNGKCPLSNCSKVPHIDSSPKCMHYLYILLFFVDVYWKISNMSRFIIFFKKIAVHVMPIFRAWLRKKLSWSWHVCFYLIIRFFALECCSSFFILNPMKSENDYADSMAYHTQLNSALTFYYRSMLWKKKWA